MLNMKYSSVWWKNILVFIVFCTQIITIWKTVENSCREVLYNSMPLFSHTIVTLSAGYFIKKNVLDKTQSGKKQVELTLLRNIQNFKETGGEPF